MTTSMVGSFMVRHRLLFVGWLLLSARAAVADDGLFQAEVAPILQQHCVRCHQGPKPKGGLDLSRADGESRHTAEGGVIVPGQPDASLLIRMISGKNPKMPKTGDPLTGEQVNVLRRWIAQGARWPAGLVLKEARSTWWSLEPLQRPTPPQVSDVDRQWVRTPIDAFVIAKLREQGLSPAPEADRRTLIRRLSFDLIGLPPAPEEVEAFVNDPDPRAYNKLVERLLDSPHYGERWARHWLDVAHYGDTHGFDKDKLRPHAWPYRDYVIRSFNEDKPYHRFVEEQLAGDDFDPYNRDGITALGFLAAGPWDFVGQVEVRPETMEKQRVRNLDRDDMVATTMNAFVSLTVQCARCHDHKFDPITQEDYYSLQAVFAAVDRADRPYDPDPDVARTRAELQRQKRQLSARQLDVNQQIAKQAGPELDQIDRRIDELRRADSGKKRPEFGYHSAIESKQDVEKWVQVDLGQPTPIHEILFVGCHDDFAGIGAGFGFPLRYRIQVSNAPEFQGDMVTVLDRTGNDVPNPGIEPQTVTLDGPSEPGRPSEPERQRRPVRYVRITATKLAERSHDYIFALAELKVLTPDGTNAAAGATVTALDSIEAPPRWRKANLVDGYYYGMRTGDVQAELSRLRQRWRELLQKAVEPDLRREQTELSQRLREVESQLQTLPEPQLVYAAASHFQPQGNFQPTEGAPRPVYLLGRGSVKNPQREVGPGTVSCVPELPARFDLGTPSEEGARRAALAEWIVDNRNPLTWRSIVNRVWQYHFGRGLVDSPSDFGRMGAKPTHPELLNWLAVEFRDGGQSLKDLHRTIVTSAVYRQASMHNPKHAAIDGSNRFLWRMNRRRLEAETIRDAVLAVSGQLNPEMGGPGFKPFGFKDDHSPHYYYARHDPDDPKSHRRSVYRFIVRSVPDPFMQALDCADPSLTVAKRNQTLTALQALALLNDKFMLCMAGHFADRVKTSAGDVPGQIEAVYRLAFGRVPTAFEIQTLIPIAREHGMANVCRLIFNTNEFVYVD